MLGLLAFISIRVDSGSSVFELHPSRQHFFPQVQN